MQATLTFPGGAVAALSSSMASGEPFRADMSIKGSKGEIRFINPLAPHHGAHLELSASGHRQTAEISPITTYTWQLDAVGRAILTGATTPVEGEMISRQQAVLDRVYEAAGLKHLRYL